ncbi:MAG: VWA domain-containing protein [Acidobacteriota bacterium]|nr:VWA domain-containing protein [Acidobacteriota bacterium]
MRWPSIAAAVVTLALAAYPGFSGAAKSAAAAARASAQDAGPGPMLPPGETRPKPAPAPPNPQNLPQASRPLQVRTNVVNVFATVRDHHNMIMTDLDKSDFKVFEDGVEQKVAYFDKEMNLPLTLAMLMDTSGSMSNILIAEQDAASRFVHEVIRKRDEALVMSFDLDVNLLADFTEDPGVLEEAIRRTRINAAGPVITAGTVPQKGVIGTDLYDAIYLACNDELASQSGRKATIVLTDAEDNGSKETLDEAIEAAQKADTVIHVILITDPSEAAGYGPGVAHDMAEQTGGRVIRVHNDSSLEKAFDVISEELRSQYVIGYYPTNTRRDGTYRKIKVEVDRPGAKILARNGYFAPY